MALPDLSAYSYPLPTVSQLCITFPGGGQLCAQAPGTTPPDPMSQALALLGNVNAALMPLQPIFDIMAVVTDLVNCIKAVEACLGPPPNPTKLIKCFPKLAEDVAKLLEILPPLSVPVMIAGILQMVLTFLEGLRAQIVSILNVLLSIATAQIRAQKTGSKQLLVSINIANSNLNGFLAGLAAATQPITCLLNLINSLLGLVGLPPLNIGLNVGADPSVLEAILTPIDDIILILQALLATLPLGGTC